MNPGIAYRPCDFCQKFLHNEDTGEVMRNPSGEPFLRPRGNLPPCRTKGMSCDKGTPEEQRNHTPQNQKAYQHYLECKAIGRFPSGPDGEIDPIVRRNARILMEAEAACEREEWTQFRISALQIMAATQGLKM